jgi:hypothetical protein
LRENPKKHKFKFEGIQYDPAAHPRRDSKALFDYFISTQTKVKGTAIRREVVFNFENNIIQGQVGGQSVQNMGGSIVGNIGSSQFQNAGSVAIANEADTFLTKNLNNNNMNNPNITNNPNVPNSPNIVNSIKNESPFQPNLNLISDNQSTTKPPNKELEKQLQDMKIEYYKYKHQLNNLTETYKNLKSRADIEKKTPDANSTPGATCKYIKKLNIFTSYCVSEL